jgi:hypothetical protein
MRLFRVLRMRFRSWFAKHRADAELDTEIQFHFERHVEENLAHGMTGDEARYAALRDIGGTTQVKEVCRDMRGMNWIENFQNDLRYAIRGLRKVPRFTAAVVSSVALGIGANTAIFSAIDAVMLRTIAVERPHELVQVQQWLPEYNPGWAWAIFTYSDFTLFPDNNQVFADMAAASRRIANARIGADPEAGKGAYVSANFYRCLACALTSGALRSTGRAPFLITGFGSASMAETPP